MTPQEQQLISVICPAIQSRKLIRFWYVNASGRMEWRQVEPYIIGSFPRKHIQLLAWLLPTPEQILSGQKEGWRNYALKNISDIQFLDESFPITRKDYDPKGNGMSQVFCAAKSESSPLRIV
jgi:predicted DNA-binding transcriptional regulator YafY